MSKTMSEERNPNCLEYVIVIIMIIVASFVKLFQISKKVG